MLQFQYFPDVHTMYIANGSLYAVASLRHRFYCALHIAISRCGVPSLYFTVPLKVIHPRCALFKCYIKKHSLLQHTYKFSTLLLSALSTNRHETFYFLKSCPVKNYPICMSKIHWTALDKLINVWWFVNKAETNNLENLYVCCGILWFIITFTVFYVSLYFSNTRCSPAITHVSLARLRNVWMLFE